MCNEKLQYNYAHGMFADGRAECPHKKEKKKKT